MSTWETIAAAPFVQRLGWTLLHSVWQATAVALVLAVALRAIPARRSDVRYGTCCWALLAVCLWFVLTLFMVPPVGRGDLSAAADSAGGANPASAAAEAGGATRDRAGRWPAVGGPVPAPGANEGTSQGGRRADRATRRAPELARVWNAARAPAVLQAATPWLVAVWLLGACGVGVWHLGGFVAVRRLRRRASRPAESVLALARECAQRLGLRRAVRVLCSATVSSPAVVALVPPTILLPAALLTGLTPAEVQALLLHELAHIRRHDGWVNLLQAVVESLLFYHPAVWWISREIRAERENCCDDVASAALGSRFAYARALTAVFSYATETPAAGCAAVAGTGGSLVQRIERLLLPAPPQDLAAFRALAGLLVLAGALAAAALASYGSARSARADGLPGEAPKPLGAPETDSALHSAQARVFEEIWAAGGMAFRDENQPGRPVVEVGLGGRGRPATDALLARLPVLRDIREVSLVECGASEAGLMHLLGLTQLQTLHVLHTPLRNAFLERLRELPQLQVLVLDDTQVSDDGSSCRTSASATPAWRASRG